MATNQYFKQGYAGEQELLQDLITESIQIYGQDCYYLPRTIVEKDDFLGEAIESSFDSAVEIELYVEQFDSFEGEGNLFQKFGLEIRDQFEMSVSKERWENDIYLQTDHERPYEGSLVYFPVSKSLFEIKFVEHELPFYQLNSFPKYLLKLELFEYGGEPFNTGVDEIDEIEYRYGSGGLTLTAEKITGGAIDSDALSQMRGEFFSVPEGKSAKVYSAAHDESASPPELFVFSFGQYQGGFVPDAILTPDSSPFTFRVVSVYDLDNPDSDDTTFMPNDPGHSDNVTIEKEADDIIDFSEDNPFGEF